MVVPGEALIQFRGVRKEFANGTVAVEHLDLDVCEHELLTLVGPSGCGKSTTLRMANRLEEPSAGKILLHGKNILEQDPVELRRSIGYVIQNVGLFPHRTVAQNVATVPRLLGWDRRRTGDRVAELLDLVGLDPDTYAKRFPHELSGGERQRVGVARALATDPLILLMDEPFGAVDPQGRRRLQAQFRDIHERLGTTVMLVTHDIDEAVSLGDRVALFSQGGIIEQIGEPVSILAQPANETVQEFLGSGRSVRLLAVGRVSRDNIEPVSAGRLEPDAPKLALGTSLEDALSLAVGAGHGLVVVTDETDDVVGQISSTGIVRALHRLNDSGVVEV